MTATLTPTIAIPAHAKDSDTPAQAAAKVWLAAKGIEDDAKDAKADRKQAETILASLLNDGDTVTLDGNRTLTFKVSDRERVIESKVIAALRILHPEIAGTIDRLKADPANRTAFTVYDLKSRR